MDIKGWFKGLAGGAARRMLNALEINFVNLDPSESPRQNIDRRTSRDRPVGYTIAPLPARQVWELHRVREESRQLSVSHPTMKAFLTWAVDATLGHEPPELSFPLPPDARTRLADPIEAIRMEWKAWQELPIGGGDESAVEVCAKALWTRLVDGDCFLVPYRDGGGKFRLRIYNGDALAEQQTTGNRNGIERVLGVERNRSGTPLGYYFGLGSSYGGVYAYSVPWMTLREMRLPAWRVWHVRDMREGGGRARGNPWAMEALSEMLRLDDFFEAFVRAAITRNSIAVGLEQMPEAIAPPPPSKVGTPFRREGDAGRGKGRADNEVRRYQHFADDAGRFLEIAPGYKAVSLATGNPTAQEAQTVAMMERRICASLGVSPSTLLGDYSSVSFSAGQLLRHQEASTIKRYQGMLRRQVLRRMYGQFFTDRWTDWLQRFPRLMPEDRALLMYPRHVLPRYQVLDQAKTIGPVQKAFESGLIDLVEARGLIGMGTPDPGAYIEEALAYLRAFMGAIRQNGEPEPDGGDDDGDGDDGDDDDRDGDRDDDGEEEDE